jgi:hypothetical protein
MFSYFIAIFIFFRHYNIIDIDYFHYATLIDIAFIDDTGAAIRR